METKTNTTIELARTALEAEGIDAYFPTTIPADFYEAHETGDYDHWNPLYDVDTYVSALSLYLDDNPSRWYCDTETFDFEGDLNTLATYIDTDEWVQLTTTTLNVLRQLDELSFAQVDKHGAVVSIDRSDQSFGPHPEAVATVWLNHHNELEWQ